MTATRATTLLFLAATLAPAGCDAPPPPLTEAGVPWALARHRARTISEPRYRIELSVPPSLGEPLRGRTTIAFEWHDPDGHSLVLDFMRPDERVRSVRVNGAEAEWRAVHDHVVVAATALADGPNEVEVLYEAGDESLNRTEDFLYALFVPDRAHFSLPVFDQPDLKGTVEWSVEVPEGWRVVANGPEVRDDGEAGEGRVRVEFGATPPLPTYLFSFAAGRFEVERATVGGRSFRMFHRETDPEKVARNRDAIFELHAGALDWLEEYTGIAYPFGKFDFVLIPAFQYGGMEHPGAVFYRQDGLMLDRSATESRILGRASVIAHETAHMWFGDLVTMRWFDDVWTKEVFANFMAAKIVRPSFPEVDHDLRFLLAHQPAAYGVDRTPGANPIRQPLDNLREAGTLYGPIIYQKAPVVMRQLEARVGEEAFRDGLREYLERHAYGNATWPDLIEILDRGSREDLAAWSRVWVEEAGRPRVVVAREGADLVVRQEDPDGLGRIWPQRLVVRLAYSDGERDRAIEIAAEPVRLEDAARDLLFALPTSSGLEYGAVVLDPESVDHLVRNVSALGEPRIRGAAWVALWEHALDGTLSPDPFLDAALAALEVEDVELVLSRVLGYLDTAYWRLLDPAARERWAPDVEAAVWAGVHRDLPLTARSGFLSAYRDVALTDAGVARLGRIWAGEERPGEVPLSENDRTALARALALRGVPDAERVLDDQEAAIGNPDRRARFHFARPALSSDPAVREAFFRLLADPASREREPWVLDGLTNLHHPLRAGAALPLIRPALDLLEEVQRTGDIFFPGRWLDATLGGHNEPEAARTVRDFLRARPDLPPRLRAKVLQSADMVERGARIAYGWTGAS